MPTTESPFNLLAMYNSGGLRAMLRAMQVGNAVCITVHGERGMVNLRSGIANAQRAIGAKFATRNLHPQRRVNDALTLARHDDMRKRKISIQIERIA